MKVNNPNHNCDKWYEAQYNKWVNKVFQQKDEELDKLVREEMIRQIKETDIWQIKGL